MKYQLQPTFAEFNIDGFVVTAGYALVYNTNPGTGEFVSATYEYLAVGLGIPPHVHLDAPNEVDDEHAIVRHDDKWTYPIDHRGKKIYSTENGVESTVTTIGDIPDGYTLLKPSSDFDEWNGEKWVLNEAKKHQYFVDIAVSRKKDLLSSANEQISYLQDAIDAEIATDEEIKQLSEWKKYRVLLNRIDVNKAPDIDWPTITDMQ